ncbi:MAG: AI-2E family transporter [Alphaproteobacteria bacterium]|nr:AI-2E family transporter [Alphaproteobacteria bacterium]
MASHSELVDELSIEAGKADAEGRAAPRVMSLARADDEDAATALVQNLPTILLTGIFALLLLAALYFLRELAVPIVFSFILSTLLQPVMRLLERIPTPRILNALVLVFLLCGLVAALIVPLSGPAAGWFDQAPKAMAKLENWVDLFKGPIQQLAQVTQNVDKLTDNAAAPAIPVAVKGEGLGSLLVTGTRSLVVGWFTTMLLLFFLLVTGDLFLRRLIEIVPTYSNKKQVVEISREIERNISQYLVTISLMNLLVGTVTGIAAYFCGLADPLLWGTVAFVLNYVPIIGPLCCSAILFLAGLLTFDSAVTAFIPAGIYLAIHLIEADSVTPMLLAKRFTLNPVLVIISIVFWYWMWGVMGAFLAVPMLASFKLICDRVTGLAPLGHFLSGDLRD